MHTNKHIHGDIKTQTNSHTNLKYTKLRDTLTKYKNTQTHGKPNTKKLYTNTDTHTQN